MPSPLMGEGMRCACRAPLGEGETPPHPRPLSRKGGGGLASLPLVSISRHEQFWTGRDA